MSKKVHDTPEQLRIYHIGMHYIQIIQKYKLSGELLLQNYYTKLFLDLCKTITENPNEAAKILEDDIIKLIDKVNIGRNALASEMDTAASLNNPKATKELFALTDKPKKTCEILTFCLKKHVPPPPLDPQSYEYKYAVTDESIKPTDLKFHLKSLDVIESKPKKSQYFFEFEFPFYDLIRTDELSPGNIDYQNTFGCIKRTLPQSRFIRYMKKKIVIKLYEVTKKLLKREENLVAQIQIPLTAFSNEKSLSKTFMMDPTEKTSSDQYNVDLSMVISAPLVTKQIEKRKVDYLVIKQGTQMQLPWIIPPREMNKLTKEEMIALSADLIPMPKLPDLEFIPVSIAKHYFDLFQHDIDAFKKHNVVVSQNLIDKRDKYQKQYNALSVGLANKQIDANQYKNHLAILLKDQVTKMKALKPAEMSLKPEYLERINLIKQEYDEFKNASK